MIEGIKNIDFSENNANFIKSNEELLAPKSSIIHTASKNMFGSIQQSGIFNESPVRSKSSFPNREDYCQITKQYITKAKEEGKMMNKALREKKIQESKVE